MLLYYPRDRASFPPTGLHQSLEQGYGIDDSSGVFSVIVQESTVQLTTYFLTHLLQVGVPASVPFVSIFVQLSSTVVLPLVIGQVSLNLFIQNLV